jgi:hypothetical protein
MSVLLLILFGIFAIGIITLIVLFLKKNGLNTALGSLIGLLASLVAGIVAPEIEGKGDIAFHLGPIGSITAQWARINTVKPTEVWYLGFITIGFLTFVTLCFVYKKAP